MEPVSSAEPTKNKQNSKLKRFFLFFSSLVKKDLDYSHSYDKSPNKISEKKRYAILTVTSLLSAVLFILMILIVNNII